MSANNDCVPGPCKWSVGLGALTLSGYAAGIALNFINSSPNPQLAYAVASSALGIFSSCGEIATLYKFAQGIRTENYFSNRKILLMSIFISSLVFTQFNAFMYKYPQYNYNDSFKSQDTVIAIWAISFFTHVILFCGYTFPTCNPENNDDMIAFREELANDRANAREELAYDRANARERQMQRQINALADEVALLRSAARQPAYGAVNYAPVPEYEGPCESQVVDV